MNMNDRSGSHEKMNDDTNLESPVKSTKLKKKKKKNKEYQ